MTIFMQIAWVAVVIIALLLRRFNISTLKKKGTGQTPLPTPQVEVLPEEPRRKKHKHAEEKRYFSYENATTAVNEIKPNPKRIEETEQEPQANNTPQQNDFDLRKAIVYSEILKPKFDE